MHDVTRNSKKESHQVAPAHPSSYKTAMQNLVMAKTLKTDSSLLKIWLENLIFHYDKYMFYKKSCYIVLVVPAYGEMANLYIIHLRCNSDRPKWPQLFIPVLHVDFINAFNFMFFWHLCICSIVLININYLCNNAPDGVLRWTGRCRSLLMSLSKPFIISVVHLKCICFSSEKNECYITQWIICFEVNTHLIYECMCVW